MRIEPLNAFDAYLKDPHNPRWVETHGGLSLGADRDLQECLLKTRWLCKKDRKRVLLMEPNIEQTGVVFGVQIDVPKWRQPGAAAGTRQAHRIGHHDPHRRKPRL